VAVLTTVAVLLAACSSDDDEDQGGKGRGGCDTGKGTLVVGVIAPLAGSLAAQGKGVENATRLAVDQANKDCAVSGYRLQVQAENDGGDSDLGAQVATKLAAVDNLVGVVSTVDSTVAEKVQPILDEAGILQISPGDTADALSRGDAFAGDPKRPYKTYFRTCTLDSLQAPFAADYLVDKERKRSIAIVTDGVDANEELADAFAARTKDKGGKIVTRQRTDQTVTDFTKVIAALTPFNPDAVYFAGQYPQAGGLSAQLAAAHLTVPVMGGDGVFDGGFLTSGGKDGDLATKVGAPTDDLDSARGFAKAYEKAGYKEDPGPFGAYAYDAAKAIIGSLATTVGDGKWSGRSRHKLVDNAGHYHAKGATGPVAFDEFGDIENRVLTVYEVRGGKWNTAETSEYEK
jgi:branched-chain amino acid transport system substrate-binding protein